MFSRFLSSRYVLAYLFMLGLTILLTACGGGGGGGGGPSYPDLSYKGVQTEAVIDQNNSDDFPFVALEGGSESTNIPLPLNVDYQSTGLPDKDTLKKFSGVIVDKIKYEIGNTKNMVAGATETISGSCGGSVKVSSDETNTTFTGAMTFNNYCEGGLGSYGYEFIMHGKITFNGDYYLDANNSPVITGMNINIEYLKFSYNDGTTVEFDEFSGSINITFDGNGFPTDLTLSVNFKYKGKIYKTVNFQVDEFTGNISGTLYHPDHGYVTIVTTTPFVYNPVDERFCSGVLEITGSDGAGNTALIEFTDYACTTYDICVTINAVQQCSTGNAWGTAPGVWN